MLFSQLWTTPVPVDDIGAADWVPVDEIRVVGGPSAAPAAGVSCFCTLWVGSGPSEMKWKDPHHP